MRNVCSVIANEAEQSTLERSWIASPHFPNLLESTNQATLARGIAANETGFARAVMAQRRQGLRDKRETAGTCAGTLFEKRIRGSGRTKNLANYHADFPQKRHNVRDPADQTALARLPDLWKAGAGQD